MSSVHGGKIVWCLLSTVAKKMWCLLFTLAKIAWCLLGLVSFVLHSELRFYFARRPYEVSLIAKQRQISNEFPSEFHQDSMSVWCIPPYTPLLYSKTGVYRGIHFLIFALKHILWVLVLTCIQNLCFEQK